MIPYLCAIDACRADIVHGNDEHHSAGHLVALDDARKGAHQRQHAGGKCQAGAQTGKSLRGERNALGANVSFAFAKLIDVGVALQTERR